jgi:hypothetical protein
MNRETYLGHSRGYRSFSHRSIQTQQGLVELGVDPCGPLLKTAPPGSAGAQSAPSAVGPTYLKETGALQSRRPRHQSPRNQRLLEGQISVRAKGDSGLQVRGRGGEWHRGSRMQV